MNREELAKDLEARGFPTPVNVPDGATETQVAYLQLNDYVSFGCDPFDWGMVTHASEHSVTVTRPYLHTSEASYASHDGGLRVIPYVGWEEVTLQRSDPRPVKVVFRSTVPK